MFRPRVIPCLLLKDLGLVKSIKFKNHRYVGDPMNAVKIFNDKGADELIFLDITASKEKRKINLELIQKIGYECNMPFSVGGGIKSVENIREILNAGSEKIAINSHAHENPNLIREAANMFGSSAIIISIDVKKNLFGKKKVYTHNGKESTGKDPVEFAQEMVEIGAGEILINSIDEDGKMLGYDLNLIRSVSDAVSVPVVAMGGAGNLKHFKEAVEVGNASAVAAGSLFVFHGKRKAVLISFPKNDELIELFR